jgi:hypothetical protein
MRERELIERLAAEIEDATATGDDARARKLADLQVKVVAQISRGGGFTMVPLRRPAPEHERAS